jgi:uncharacterized protein with HEPN domain
MSRDSHLSLLDIRQAHKKGLGYATGLTFEEFTKDDKTYE